MHWLPSTKSVHGKHRGSVSPPIAGYVRVIQLEDGGLTEHRKMEVKATTTTPIQQHRIVRDKPGFYIM